jgi:hypothetical protein
MKYLAVFILLVIMFSVVHNGNAADTDEGQEVKLHDRHPADR